MARRRDAFYYDSVTVCADCALRASRLLMQALEGFSAEGLGRCREEMRALEDEADEKRRALLDALATAFITPVDREDLVELSGALGAVTDSIGEALDCLYCNDVRAVRADAPALGALVVQGCEEVRALAGELSTLGKSRTVHERIAAIDALGREGGRAFVEALRRLRVECADPLEVMTWHEVYRALERCVDSCEHVAETMNVLAMKNG